MEKYNIKFAAITAYDFSFSQLFSNQDIPVILGGDSLGMTIQDHTTTIPVQMSDMIYHTKAVRKSVPTVFLLSDLPFISYCTTAQAIKNTKKLYSPEQIWLK